MRKRSYPPIVRARFLGSILSVIMVAMCRSTLASLVHWLLALNSRAFAFSSRPVNNKLSARSMARMVSPPRIPRCAATNIDDDTSVITVKPFVQRYYETYRWIYKENYYKINYRVEGPQDRVPILLVHGFGANVNHFRHQFPALVKEGYRVYAIDLLGFGGSDKPKEESYSIDLFAELLVDFVQDVEPGKKWIVAGNSIGGLCSLVVASYLPKLIKAVVLFNCAGGMTGFRYSDVPFYLRPVLYFVQKVVLGREFGSRFFKNFKSRENVESILRQQGVYGDTTNADEELIEILLGPAEDDGAEEVFLSVFAGPPGPTPESLLPKIACPILALWGTADPWTPIDGGSHPGSSFSNFTDNYTLIPLEGVGHCPHDECPDVVNSKMIEWLSGLEQK